MSLLPRNQEFELDPTLWRLTDEPDLTIAEWFNLCVGLGIEHLGDELGWHARRPSQRKAPGRIRAIREPALGVPAFALLPPPGLTWARGRELDPKVVVVPVCHECLPRVGIVRFKAYFTLRPRSSCSCGLRPVSAWSLIERRVAGPH